jgi:hypothetical protein
MGRFPRRALLQYGRPERQAELQLGPRWTAQRGADLIALVLSIAHQSCMELGKAALVAGKRFHWRQDPRDHDVGIPQHAHASALVSCRALERTQAIAIDKGPERAQSTAQTPQTDAQLMSTVGVVALQYGLSIDQDLLGRGLKNG